MQITQTITQNLSVNTPAMEEVAESSQPLYSAAMLIERKAIHLLQELVASGLFNAAELEALQEWGPEFFESALPLIASDEGKEEVALALCYLSESIIFAPFARLMEDHAKQNQLTEYENTVKEMIALALPEGVDVEGFMTAYRAYNDRDQTLELLSAQIDIFYQEEQAQLYASAREADTDLTEHYETTCDRLRAIVESKKSAKNQGAADVHALSAKIDAVYETLQQQKKAAEATFDRMEKHEAAFQSTLNRATMLTNKGKIS